MGNRRNCGGQHGDHKCAANAAVHHANIACLAVNGRTNVSGSGIGECLVTQMLRSGEFEPITAYSSMTHFRCRLGWRRVVHNSPGIFLICSGWWTELHSVASNEVLGG